MTNEFFKVCKLSDLSENKGKRFIVNDTDVAIFKIGEEIFAVSNICPHQKSATMFEGCVEDEFVVCPIHAWKFNLRTGKTPENGNGLRTFEVKIENDFVFVKVEEKQLNW